MLRQSCRRYLGGRAGRTVSIVACLGEPSAQQDAMHAVLSKLKCHTRAFTPNENGWSEIEDAMSGAEVLVVGRRDLPLLTRLVEPRTSPKLRWLHVLGAGVDHLPFAHLRARRVTRLDHVFRAVNVTHHRGVSSTALAEFAVAGFFHFSQNVPALVQNFSSRVWAPPSLGPRQLSSGTVGIVGAPYLE